jgi:hypothetical protein
VRPVTPASGQPAAERLAGDDQVGLDAIVLDRPHRPGAPATGLHLVVDIEDLVPVAMLFQRVHEFRRHRNEAALTLHGLQHEARDVGRVDVLLEEQVEPCESILGADAAVRVGRWGPVDARCERPESLLVDELGGHRHRQVRAAVERTVEDDDTVAAGRCARDLHRVLDRLCARVEQQALGRRVAGPELVEPATHLDVRLVHADHEALVEVLVDLLVDCAHDAGRAVAEVLARDAAAEVEIFAPLGVPDACAPGPADHEVGRRDSARDVAFARLEDFVGGRPLVDLHQSCGLSPDGMHVFNGHLPRNAWRSARFPAHCASGAPSRLSLS